MRHDQVKIAGILLLTHAYLMADQLPGQAANGQVLDARSVETALDTMTFQSYEPTPVRIQRIDEMGRVISAYDLSVQRISVSSRPTASFPIAEPNASITAPTVVLYDNTLDEFSWYDPGPLLHVEDFGTSPGGLVTKFNFGYVTADFLPISLSIRFYSGTDGANCPGTFLAGWLFTGLDPSFFGFPEQIAYEFDIPIAEQFTLPAGTVGYSYEFANYNTGVWLTRGGSGNIDNVWLNCQLGSFSNAWAGTYMTIFGEPGSSDTCLVPPDFDADLIPAAAWQTTGTVNVGFNGCRIYRMNLNTTAQYDFSLCVNDGVGSSSVGDGDLEMFDATGTLLWYIDGESSCNWAASTLGTAFQGWTPPTPGTHYLKVSEFSDSGLDFNLAYKAMTLSDPNIVVEPATLEFSCNAGQAVAVAPLPNAPAIEAMLTGSDKLFEVDKIMQQFQNGSGVARIIVHLAEPTGLRTNMNWQSEQSRESQRRRIDQRQRRVLDRFKTKNVFVKYCYKNLCAFSCDVSTGGLQDVMNDPEVVAIEPVFEVKMHLRQGIPLMNALEARQSFTGAGMSIAIIDTGIDYNHPMLGGGGFPNDKVLGGFDFGDNDADPMAGHSHGTNVAGLAAGNLGDVGDYIGGVAPDAKLYALKITAGTSGSADTEDMIAAWDWCVTHQNDDPNNPIMVMNTSFGGNQFFAACDSASPGMTLAAANAVAAGITNLASSGNEGWCDSLAWSVGAVYDAAFGTNTWCVSGLSCANIAFNLGCGTGWSANDASAVDKVTVYSNSASFLDVLAPSNQAYTTDLSSGYTGSFGGTSAASPYAAGFVACLQSAAKASSGQFLTPTDIRQIIIDSGDPITDTKVAITKPRLNLANAISAAACNGTRLSIKNDGGQTLEISDILKPDWVTLSSSPPYSITGGGRVSLCVEADCTTCGSEGLSGSLDILSNDPDPNTLSIPISVLGPCINCAGPSDLNEDCDTNMKDFSLFAQSWLEEECSEPTDCDGADINASGSVDAADLSLLVEQWLQGNAN
jgi:subtilisin family serine protease